MKKLKLDAKILLLEGIHENAVNAFEKAGYTNVELLPKSLPTAELKQKIADVAFIGIRSRTNLTADVLSHAKELLAIGCFCIGTNQVDLEAAANLGITVFNSPFSNTRSVAELTIASMVHLMRGIPQKNLAAHRGEWQKSAKNSFEVRQKNLGIIGYGNIGSQVSNLASAFGIHVYFYDTFTKLPHGNARSMDSMEELLKISDVVSLHVPALESTKNMFGAAEFEMMKEGSFLINYARGNVVDIEALEKNLQSGKILGAALDVFPVEPKSLDEEFVSPLRKYENVLLSPHIGGSTQEAQENIGTDVAGKLIGYHASGITAGAVNMPEAVVQTKPENSYRIQHVHANQPGMLQKINDIVSGAGLNILSQVLQTKDQTGYVVIDIEHTEKIEEIVEKLSNIDGTVKARLMG